MEAPDGAAGASSLLQSAKPSARWCLCCFALGGWSAEAPPPGRDDLVSIDAAQPHTRRAYILGGYRRRLNWAQAWHSLSYVHNETGNVLTHAVGLVAFLLMALHFTWTRPAAWEVAEAVVFATFVVGCSLCFILSSAYHLFSCVGFEATHDKMLACDLGGIVASILTSFYIALWTAFHCDTQLRITYCAMITAMCAWLCVVVGTRKLRADLRIVLASFIVAVGSALFPLVHYAVRNWGRGLEDETGAQILSGAVANVACYAIGIVFYASKVPERWCPGAFDNWLHSHQLWHICCFLGPVCLLYTSERTVGNSVCCSAHEDGFTFPTAAQCATLDVTEDAMVCSALTCMGS